jgi:hypothetical protein
LLQAGPTTKLEASKLKSSLFKTINFTFNERKKIQAEMAPVTPFWDQPSHPNVQKVQFSTEKDFTTKSHSTITLPPFALFAKMAFPPCTLAEKATYATVQIGREQHMNLNSDLVYINHSCMPSVVSTFFSHSLPSQFQIHKEKRS